MAKILKRLLGYALLLATLGFVGLLFLEARSCIDADATRSRLEARRSSPEIAVIRQAKELCERRVAEALNAQKIGYSKLRTYELGTTQLYREVRVGAYGPGNDVSGAPEMAVRCLTALDATAITKLEETREPFDAAGKRDAHDALELQIFERGLSATRCTGDIPNPFYRILKSQ